LLEDVENASKKITVSAKPFYSNPSISSEAAIAEMDKDAFRLGTNAEPLILGA
jgi:hypothetical protein